MTAPIDHQPYNSLTPDTVIDAIESIDYLCDLRVFPLNSYENRVYQVGIEGEEPLIAKFYRPGRWSDEQILEEHTFTLALAELEIPVIAPKIVQNKSLFQYKEHRFSLTPRRGGHAPELDNLDTLYTLGQHIGRIHEVSKTAPFKFRPEMSVDAFGIQSRTFLLENNFIPQNLIPAYESLAQHLIDKVNLIFKDHPYDAIRLHGDCHPGNIIQRQDSLYIVDLDDCRSGPAIQDLWMLLSGDSQQKSIQLETILEGYEEFSDFRMAELQLVEGSRTLRLMHYAAWLARRWQDPAFPMAFPCFNTERYWAEHILELREQMSILDEPTVQPASFI